MAILACQEPMAQLVEQTCEGVAQNEQPLSRVGACAALTAISASHSTTHSPIIDPISTIFIHIMSSRDRLVVSEHGVPTFFKGKSPLRRDRLSSRIRTAAHYDVSRQQEPDGDSEYTVVATW